MAYKTREELMNEIETKNQEIKELKNDIQKLDRYKQYEDAANEVAAIRDSFVAAGFSKSEAFELLKAMTATAVGMQTLTKR